MTFMTCLVISCTLTHLYIILGTTETKSQTIKDSTFEDTITHSNGDAQNGCNGEQVEPTRQQIKESKPSLATKAVIAFSAIENTKNLIQFDNRHAVLDTIRFLLTFAIFATQEFGLNVMFTPHKLRNHLLTAPIEMIRSNWYWFIRVPGLWNDCFTFTL